MGKISKLVNTKGNINGFAKQHPLIKTLNGYKKKQVGIYEKKFL